MAATKSKTKWVVTFEGENEVFYYDGKGYTKEESKAKPFTDRQAAIKTRHAQKYAYDKDNRRFFHVRRKADAK